MAEKAKKIDLDGIKLYGVAPRTIGTLITVLVVTSSFGLIGWRQLQSSKAQSINTTASVTSNYNGSQTTHYEATTTTQSSTTTYPSNFHSRLIFFAGLIIATIALLIILKLWA